MQSVMEDIGKEISDSCSRSIGRDPGRQLNPAPREGGVLLGEHYVRSCPCLARSAASLSLSFSVNLYVSGE